MTLAQALEQRGKRQGKQQGIVYGLKQAAKNMLCRGMDINVVAEITGLSESVITRLKRVKQTTDA